MRSNRNSSPLAIAPEKTSQRRHGRLRCENLQVVIGSETAKVLDLSASGMRVRMIRDPGIRQGAHVCARVSSAVGQVDIQACVVWCGKKGFRCFEAGLTFVSVTPQVRKVIAEIARIAGDCNTVYRA
jgi:hypothetical protein